MAQLLKAYRAENIPMLRGRLVFNIQANTFVTMRNYSWYRDLVRWTRSTIEFLANHMLALV